jgi:hypothetical protein
MLHTNVEGRRTDPDGLGSSWMKSSSRSMLGTVTISAVILRNTKLLTRLRHCLVVKVQVVQEFI